MREGAAVGFLDDIFRLAVIPDDAARDAIKAAVVALHDEAHRGGIILYGAGDQLRFVQTTLRIGRVRDIAIPALHLSNHTALDGRSP